jgi:hypothetical protein
MRADITSQPAVAWDFAAKGTLPIWLTAAGGTNGTYFDASGHLQSGAAPRFDHDLATGMALGLRVEAAATNVVIHNRDLTQSSWTATNITAALDQIGLDAGANTASSIVATAANGTICQTITLASSARFQTAYVKRITGSGVINMSMDGSTYTAIPATSQWSRVSIPSQTIANPTVCFQIVTSGDKIAVDVVQNETGTYATSPILTTTAAVTRAADTNAIIGAGLAALKTDRGAFLVKTSARVPAGTGTLLQFGTGATYRAEWGANSSGFATYFWDINGAQDLNGLGGTAGTGNTYGYVWNVGRRFYSMTFPFIVDPPSAAIIIHSMPTPTVASLGYRTIFGDQHINGCISKVAIFNTNTSLTPGGLQAAGAMF